MLKLATRSRFAGLAILLLLSGACHEAGETNVVALEFRGNQAFSDERLAGVMVTHAAGWLPWARSRPFDPGVFQSDLARLREFYRVRGYPDASVRASDVVLSDAGDEVRLTITVDEGEPVRIADITVRGFDVLDAEARTELESLPVAPGDALDLEAIETARQRALGVLRNHGYPYARVDVTPDGLPADAGASVEVVLMATPGPASVFGPVSIAGLSDLDEGILRRELAFAPGQPYRERAVRETQRRLGALEILDFVNVEPQVRDDAQPREVPVVITATEGLPRKLTLGAGYGSEDRLRGLVEWSHLNFLGGAREVAFEARYSAVTRGVEARLHQPHALTTRLSLDVRASSWWTYERSYRSRSAGGRAGLTYVWVPGDAAASRRTGDVLTLGYVHDFLSYRVSDDERPDFEELVALGLDPVTGRGSGTRAGLTASFERQVVDDTFDPRAGYGASVRAQFIRPAFGGTFDYDEFMVEGRGYVPIGRAVVAARARVGTLSAASDADLPFSQRYFLGGASSLRGWGRYEVAPLSQGVPVGGRTLLDTALELRVPMTDQLGAVVFIDAGNVWTDDWDVRWSDLRRDAGFGVRYRTPIGLIRADLARQLTPIDGLTIDGEAQTRRWRVHFSIGQAF